MKHWPECIYIWYGAS